MRSESLNPASRAAFGGIYGFAHSKLNAIAVEGLSGSKRRVADLFELRNFIQTLINLQPKFTTDTDHFVRARRWTTYS